MSELIKIQRDCFWDGVERRKKLHRLVGRMFVVIRGEWWVRRGRSSKRELEFVREMEYIWV